MFKKLINRGSSFGFAHHFLFCLGPGLSVSEETKLDIIAYSYQTHHLSTIVNASNRECIYVESS